jgi:hypothetical protein
MKHYTYKIDFVDGYYYYGVRQCECDPIEDVYFGSPRTHKAKWNTTMFTKTIVSEHNTREEAMEEEKELIGDNFKSDPMCLNEHNAIHFDRLGAKHRQESKDKMKKSMKGRVISEETKRKISAALKGRKKPPRTQEHMDNLSKACKGKRGPNVGGTLTEEHKKKISEGLKRFKQRKKQCDSTGS